MTDRDITSKVISRLCAAGDHEWCMNRSPEESHCQCGCHASAAPRPLGYLHEITEPGATEPLRLYSGSPDNPWSAWTELHKARCVYRCTPLYARSAHETSEPARAYQRRVYDWAVSCFGQKDADDQDMRTFRFVEEALELAQACGCTMASAQSILEYVYGRDQGVIAQEVGGVMVSLAVLCKAFKIDLNYCAETELDRVLQNVQKIRERHAAKPDFRLPRQQEPSGFDAEDREITVLREMLMVARALMPDPDYEPSEEREVALRHIRDRIDRHFETVERQEKAIEQQREIATAVKGIEAAEQSREHVRREADK